MIIRDSWGQSYLIVRGETLGLVAQSGVSFGTRPKDSPEPWETLGGSIRKHGGGAAGCSIGGVLRNPVEGQPGTMGNVRRLNPKTWGGARRLLNRESVRVSFGTRPMDGPEPWETSGTSIRKHGGAAG